MPTEQNREGRSVIAIPAPWRSLMISINDGHTPSWERIPDGEPGIRDVDAPCSMFEPTGGPFDLASGAGDCETDGHYICVECTHISLSALRRKRDLCQECGAPLAHPQTGEECSARCDLPNRGEA